MLFSKFFTLKLGLTGGLVLGLGLGTEALIFTVSALNTGEIKEEHTDFVKKMKGAGSSKPSGGGDQGLSSKIDALMQEAKLDVNLMNSLAKSIKGLENSAKALSPASEAISASQSYSQELSKAAGQLEQLNLNYQQQVSNAKGNSELKEKINQDAQQLRAQMENLSANLAALNNVYGGMLTAMSKK